jgi:hypothetical protein
MDSHPDLLRRVPTPLQVRRQLSRNLNEADLLRRYLRLAEHKVKVEQRLSRMDGKGDEVDVER